MVHLATKDNDIGFDRLTTAGAQMVMEPTTAPVLREIEAVIRHVYHCICRERSNKPMPYVGSSSNLLLTLPPVCTSNWIN